MKTASYSFLMILAAILCSSSAAFAKQIVREISWQSEDKTFTGKLIYPDDADERLPGILMVPNWMGPTDQSLEKARKVAGDDYVVLMADLYGTDIRPTNTQEASAAAGALRSDPALMRSRAQAALNALINSDSDTPLDRNRIGAVGFCFGGGAILELARSGAKLDGLVSFHGSLTSPTLETDSANIRGKVLILHGAADPAVPTKDVTAFTEAMNQTSVDWRLIAYGGAVHSFTNPYANSPGRSQYHPKVAKMAFNEMEDFFDDIVWGD